jgi:uncharacterized membrane-anchored protein YjiN (DUF445 family)
MPLIDKIMKFAKSPQGQRAIRQATDKAQQLAKDPKNRAKIEQLRSKLQGGRGTR